MGKIDAGERVRRNSGSKLGGIVEWRHGKAVQVHWDDDTRSILGVHLVRRDVVPFLRGDKVSLSKAKTRGTVVAQVGGLVEVFWVYRSIERASDLYRLPPDPPFIKPDPIDTGFNLGDRVVRCNGSPSLGTVVSLPGPGSKSVGVKWAGPRLNYFGGVSYETIRLATPEDEALAPRPAPTVDLSEKLAGMGALSDSPANS